MFTKRVSALLCLLFAIGSMTAVRADEKSTLDDYIFKRSQQLQCHSFGVGEFRQEKGRRVARLQWNVQRQGAYRSLREDIAMADGKVTSVLPADTDVQGPQVGKDRLFDARRTAQLLAQGKWTVTRSELLFPKDTVGSPCRLVVTTSDARLQWLVPQSSLITERFHPYYRAIRNLKAGDMIRFTYSGKILPNLESPLSSPAGTRPLDYLGFSKVP